MAVPSPQDPPSLLSVREAESTILELVRFPDSQKDSESVPLEAALGRILAQPAISPLDFPHWDNSAMDGYAVRFADVRDGSPQHPARLSITAEIPAGTPPQTSLQQGQAARIFTGAMLPEGADTIVRQEDTRREGNWVSVLSPPEFPGAFVRRRGEFYRAGNLLLPAGIPLNAPEIAVLAAAQCCQVAAYRRPRAAILSTGDELVPPHFPLQPGQRVDSNQYAVAAFASQQGAVPLTLGIVPDSPERLKQEMARAIASADIVLSTGGVSVGDYDYVGGLLEELGGELSIDSVAVRPGKPLTVAKFPNGCLYFGLPGNPVSALVSCWRFVRPALRKLSGLAGGWQPEFVKARCRQELRSDGQRETYLWGQLWLVEGTYEFQRAAGSHSSGNLINLAQTNALAVLPAGQRSIPRGETVEVMTVGSTSHRAWQPAGSGF